jgi:chromosome partitioning protein
VLFVDTAPAVTEREAEAARVADLVIVPVRPRRRADRHRVDRQGRTRLGGAADRLGAVDDDDGPSLKAQDAHTEGRSVLEMRGAAARQAADELRAVWHWIRGRTG